MAYIVMAYIDMAYVVMAGQEAPHTVVVSVSGRLWTFGSCHKGILGNLHGTGNGHAPLMGTRLTSATKKRSRLMGWAISHVAASTSGYHVGGIGAYESLWLRVGRLCVGGYGSSVRPALTV